MQSHNLTINLNLNKLGGSRNATRELNRLSKAINLTSQYGFRLEEWDNKEVVDRQLQPVGTINVT